MIDAMSQYVLKPHHQRSEVAFPGCTLLGKHLRNKARDWDFLLSHGTYHSPPFPGGPLYLAYLSFLSPYCYC